MLLFSFIMSVIFAVVLFTFIISLIVFTINQKKLRNHVDTQLDDIINGFKTYDLGGDINIEDKK